MVNRYPTRTDTSFVLLVLHLERLVPLESAGGRACDRLSHGHGLRRSRGGEELLKDLAVQVRLPRFEKSFRQGMRKKTSKSKVRGKDSRRGGCRDYRMGQELKMSDNIVRQTKPRTMLGVRASAKQLRLWRSAKGGSGAETKPFGQRHGDSASDVLGGVFASACVPCLR